MGAQGEGPLKPWNTIRRGSASGRHGPRRATAVGPEQTRKKMVITTITIVARHKAIFTSATYGSTIFHVLSWCFVCCRSPLPQMKEDRERKAANAKADAELRRTLLARQAAHKQATQEEEVGGLHGILGPPPQPMYLVSTNDELFPTG